MSRKPDDTAAEIVALAQSVGLQGFAAAAEVVAITKSAALANVDKEGAEIVALARAAGLPGFKPMEGE